ncbi:hypothetical protein APQ02_22745 [Salmonella enterica]|uniref:hypothetical protein n=1 Tax=Enterobacteriaceae TaxID=543 RepID=UPI000CFEB27A|nr:MULTISPECIES: hypothetical protein [Enterobacteriaceae]EBY1879777.1 hypothetical protein [Salmonella enterica subsp. enterica serovar Senftenberg]EKK3990650.1 hypothetical protein [Cronobacter sakazakii]EAX2192965.1 hypothetical protein [Salmonella enterica]EBC8210560.1 hypothetical protein [Salmonella enterica]EBI7729937.1 hypothetical protein [Salmonella enterica]
MRFFIKVLSIVFFVALLAAMLIATEDKYSLIYEMDPSIPEGSFVDNGNGSGNEVGAAALFLILLLQFMSFYFFHGKKWRVTSVALALVAVFLFVMRVL